MRVAFRVDASVEIGAGHLMRCLALANALSESGADCAFVCRTQREHLFDKIVEAGHRVHLLSAILSDVRNAGSTGLADASWLGCGWQQDASETTTALAGERYDWLVVDHYALDARWESSIGSEVGRILVIDDLANREHACDILLDQNLGRTASDYSMLVPRRTCCLTGLKYALLRPEFLASRELSMKRRKGAPLKQILVSLGGFDRNNDTGRVLDELARFRLPNDVEVLTVMGRHSPSLGSVVDQATRMPFTCKVLVDVDDMAHVMAASDIAIGAAGGSAWERCALGLPSIVLVLAENQRSVASSLDEANAAIVLSPMGTWAGDDLRAAVHRMTVNKEREAYSSTASSLVDGCGTSRVKTAMGLT